MIKQRCLIINARLLLQADLSRLSLNDEDRHQFVCHQVRVLSHSNNENSGEMVTGYRNNSHQFV